MYMHIITVFLVWILRNTFVAPTPYIVYINSSAKWDIFHVLFFRLDIFQNQHFKKNLSEIPSEYKTVWTQNVASAQGIKLFHGLSADNTR